MLQPLNFANAAQDQKVLCALCSNNPLSPQTGHKGDQHVNKWLLPYKPQQQGCPSKMGREKVPHFASVFLFQDKNMQVRGYWLVAGDWWTPWLKGRFLVGWTLRLQEPRTQVSSPVWPIPARTQQYPQAFLRRMDTF